MQNQACKKFVYKQENIAAVDDEIIHARTEEGEKGKIFKKW